VAQKVNPAKRRAPQQHISLSSESSDESDDSEDIADTQGNVLLPLQEEMDDDDLMKQVDQHFLDYDTISKDILKLNYEAHVVPS